MHCALLLHVAMQIGLSHLSEKRAWRIVSEDSGVHRPFLLISAPLNCHCHLRSFDFPVTSTKGYSGFPAYSQVYLRNYNVWSFIHQPLSRYLCALNCFRLSIVT